MADAPTFEQRMAEHVQDKLKDLKARIARDVELDRKEGAQMVKAWWIFNENGEPVAGPYTNKATAELSLREARWRGEVGPDAYVAAGYASEDDWR
jgi:hypothetical protein